MARYRVQALVDATEERAQRVKEIEERRKHDHWLMLRERLRQLEADQRLREMLAKQRLFERRVMLEKMRDPYSWISKIKPSHWLLLCAAVALAYYQSFLSRLPPGLRP